MEIAIDFTVSGAHVYMILVMDIDFPRKVFHKTQ